MPTFIDRHELVVVPKATRHQLYLEVVQGVIDSSGTKPLGHWIEDGVIYCVLEAPNKNAVCQHHASRGLSCDELHPIWGIHEGQRVSDQDAVVIRLKINDLWHAPATAK
jgi:hypothetical protein